MGGGAALVVISHSYLFKHIATHILRRLHCNMSFLIYPHKFDAVHLHFGPAIQGDASKFSRIIYSTPHISLNGIGIVLELASAKYEQHYNKVFVSFDPGLPANQTLVSRLHAIESEIVDKYVDSISGTRQCIYSLSDQLNGGCIKSYLHMNSNMNDAIGDADADADDNAHPHPHPDTCSCIGVGGNKFMLKICGVWETRDECGITYKFIKC